MPVQLREYVTIYKPNPCAAQWTNWLTVGALFSQWVCAYVFNGRGGSALVVAWNEETEEGSQDEEGNESG